jgi:hypothetical protein
VNKVTGRAMIGFLLEGFSSIDVGKGSGILNKKQNPAKPFFNN